MSPSKLLEISDVSCEKIFEEAESGSIACLKNSMNYFANEVANIAQAVQEAELYLPTAISDKQEKVRILVIFLIYRDTFYTSFIIYCL